MIAWADRRGGVVDKLYRPRSIAIAAMAISALGFFIVLPPITQRSPLWPVALGLIGTLCGIAAVTRGVRRLGWLAVALGIVSMGLGVLATESSVGHLNNVVVWSALFASMLRYATPLTWAAIGGMFSERSGVVNIALEGMMLAGAFFGILGAQKSGSWAIGLLAAMGAGAGLALIHAFFSINLRADQIVSGTAINFLALGVTGYFFVDVYGALGTPSDIPRIPNVDLPLDRWQFIDGVFGNLNLMIWLSFALLIVSHIVMFKTPIGLRIRAVGEHPRAADTVGINVYLVRYACVIVSGMLAALGGAYLSFGFGGAFNEGMTAGKGFIALAALIFGAWRPFGAFSACLLFGFSYALAYRLPEYSGSAATLFLALPYVLTLIAVAGVIGRSIPPAAVGRPYRKQ
ncbi:MAG TPA: ABC transporter permease [Solirubrobacterales bacterium]|nr:ABC transporter permease [Solirubrobacterales bacterium]HKI23164.1 ABC transporter permease [Gaiellaceae bacterium]